MVSIIGSFMSSFFPIRYQCSEFGRGRRRYVRTKNKNIPGTYYIIIQAIQEPGTRVTLLDWIVHVFVLSDTLSIFGIRNVDDMYVRTKKKNHAILYKNRAWEWRCLTIIFLLFNLSFTWRCGGLLPLFIPPTDTSYDTTKYVVCSLYKPFFLLSTCIYAMVDLAWTYRRHPAHLSTYLCVQYNPMDGRPGVSSGQPRILLVLSPGFEPQVGRTLTLFAK